MSNFQVSEETPIVGDNFQDVVSNMEQKYIIEREKRLRADGVSQYIDLDQPTKLQQCQDDPWIEYNDVSSMPPALTDGFCCKYLVIGAGFGGLLFAVRLIQAGIPREEIYMVDSAGGYGGTWYWNRYPGLMCDVESSIYMPLLEEMGYAPKHRYSYGPELRAHADNIADKWHLREHTLFGAETKKLVWDEVTNEWVVEISMKKPDGDTKTIIARSQFALLSGGVLNIPHLPCLEGLDSFKGHTFHTSRWDYNATGGSPTDTALTNLQEKRVGIIGTGATAVQVIPHLANWAKELYVFQRTPSSVDARNQEVIDASKWKEEVANKKGWQKARKENFNAWAFNVKPLPKVNMVDDGFTKIAALRAISGTLKPIAMEDIPAYVSELHMIDIPRQQRIHARVDELIHNKDTAEKLKHWYPSWCKRSCFHDEYLPSFNAPNVHLIDTDGKGVDRITPKGVVVGATEYPLDLVIFSTGYRTPFGNSPASRAGISITGRDNLTLDSKWDSGVGTLHGVMSHGFPNLFFTSLSQTGFCANFTTMLDQFSTHVAYIISTATGKVAAKELGKVVVEANKDGEDDWTSQSMQRAAAFAAMAGCTPSYFNGEGEADRAEGLEAQMKAARGAPWGMGMVDYSRVIEEWRDHGGMEGVDVTVTR